MTGFIEGESRAQATLFPERLDDYIAEATRSESLMSLSMSWICGSLSFKTVPEDTGRPPYHPATLLKIYIYGYLNRVQSSRRLEREAQRNVELMWLPGDWRLTSKPLPTSGKTMAKPSRQVCREFVLICRKLELFTDAFVAIDGSKFKAVNNRDRNFTKAKMKRRLQQIDESIARYLSQMASADRQDTQAAKHTSERLQDKITKLKKEVKRLTVLEKDMLSKPDQQISLTDPDARSMATSGRGTGMVGYNVQTAVDAKHHLIVAHEVTNIGNDRNQLTNMAGQAQTAIDTEDLTVVADRGYFKGKEILACHEAGITTYLPRPQTSRNITKGLFSKRDFQYLPKADEYRCPAGERLIWRMTQEKDGLTLHSYWSSNCQTCSIKAAMHDRQGTTCHPLGARSSH